MSGDGLSRITKYRIGHTLLDVVLIMAYMCALFVNQVKISL